MTAPERHRNVTLSDFGNFHDAGIERVNFDPVTAHVRLILWSFWFRYEDGGEFWEPDLRIIFDFQGARDVAGNDLNVFPEYDISALNIADGKFDLNGFSGNLTFQFESFTHSFDWSKVPP